MYAYEPVEYINLIRVRTACEKLKKTDRSVTDIGTECGFASDSAFNRNFRKLMGMSPAEWRKREKIMSSYVRLSIDRCTATYV